MVLPIALGAAVAASAAVLKAKCTFFVGANECAPGCARTRDPWAPRTDLRDDAEKRKEAQRKLEAAEAAEAERLSAAAHVQQERAFMREQQHALSATVQPRAEQRPTQALPAAGDAVPHRRLVDDPAGTHRAHSGLHSTGSVFVSSVDSSNSSSFLLSGSAPFKALLVTETSVTPQWFKALAAKHHGICAFGEARCTDTALMRTLGVLYADSLPVCIIATAYSEAVRFAVQQARHALLRGTRRRSLH